MSVTVGSTLVKVTRFAEYAGFEFLCFFNLFSTGNQYAVRGYFPTHVGIAVGVAMPKAHEQEINSAASRAKNAFVKSLVMYQ